MIYLVCVLLGYGLFALGRRYETKPKLGKNEAEAIFDGLEKAGEQPDRGTLVTMRLVTKSLGIPVTVGTEIPASQNVLKQEVVEERSLAAEAVERMKARVAVLQKQINATLLKGRSEIDTHEASAAYAINRSEKLAKVLNAFGGPDVVELEKK